jgi:hypothetical protein
MKQARLATAVLRGDAVSQALMAELVSAHLKQPIAQTQWSRYEKGESEPPLAVLEATARVSGLARGWLAFGDEVIPGPVGAGGLTQAEVTRAIKKSAKKRA